MKLYVIPTERVCNAHCNFCITNSREFSGREFLSVGDLESALKKFELDSIEVTGGGEPILNPIIREILEMCIEKTPTQIYTNGVHAKKILDLDLSYLCISRSHQDSEINREIMGINYDERQIFDSGQRVKLSLVASNSGVHDYSGLMDYFDWAKQNKVIKVVVRQMFDETLPEVFEREFVSTEKLARDFDCKEKDGNLFTDYHGMNIKFELRSCACEFNNPVLHADGIIYKGWSSEELR